MPRCGLRSLQWGRLEGRAGEEYNSVLLIQFCSEPKTILKNSLLKKIQSKLNCVSVSVCECISVCVREHV